MPRPSEQLRLTARPQVIDAAAIALQSPQSTIFYSHLQSQLFDEVDGIYELFCRFC
jgi:hypothetical protein